jgi:response regulator RpfG family c-di-GMP phosphodiesterase
MYQQVQTSLGGSTTYPGKPPILIVEDDEDTRDLMRVMLSCEYECDDASDGQQALLKMMAKQYSVILTDLMMPNVDGYAVVDNAALLAPTTPVIVITGLADLQDAVKAMKTGAFDYIVKPLDFDHVEMSVQQALRQHTLAETAYSEEHKRALYTAELEGRNDELSNRLSQALAEFELNNRAVVRALALTLEARNYETRGHSDRVVTYSLRLGEALGLDAIEMRALEVGALLHDIGKLGVPDHILLKPASLTSSEWQEMKKHPLVGANIIREIPALSSALAVILQHHERWDGSGYPSGLRGEEIDLKARIFAVADAIDAITSTRPYDAARSFEEAYAELVRGSGRQFDPKVVEAFCGIPLVEWAALTNKAAACAGH